MNAIVLDQQGAATQALNASARARVATSVPTRRSTSRSTARRSPPACRRRTSAPMSSSRPGPVTVQGERQRRDAGRAAHRRAGRRRDGPAHGGGADGDAARRRQHAVVEHRAAGEAAPRQRPQRDRRRHGDADAQQRARRHRRRARARRRATRRCSRAPAWRAWRRRVGAATFYFDPTATLESSRVYSLFLLGDSAVRAAEPRHPRSRTDERTRARQVVRPRRHRGALGPALGGERRLRADARPGASPRSASSCRRRTSPARCTWGTRSSTRSWTRWSRHRRMQGDNTLWVPGTDHAGIATQIVVERQLQDAGLSRHDLGRKKFIDQVWDWKETSGSTITRQMRRMGDSVAWKYEYFTMDERLSAVVTDTFVSLYDEGPHLPRQAPRQLGPGAALGRLRPRGRERGARRDDVAHPLPVQRRAAARRERRSR